MSRQGALWRGELAQHIEEYLDGTESYDALLDWAMDHPFFDEQRDLDAAERPLLAEALGRILQLSETEPLPTRTTRDELLATMTRLRGGEHA